MSKGLKALESLMTNYYEMCQDLGNNDDQYQRCNLTSERAIIEKELKEGQKNKQALEVIFKYITIGNPFGNVHYIYLNDESEMIMPKDYEVLKEVLL